MVDVPNPEQPLTQDPQSRVSASDIASTYNLRAQQLREGDISQGLEHLGRGLDALATPIAVEAGRRAGANALVTRNPDGTPNVQLPSSFPILGDAGLAYQRAAEAGALARGQNQVLKDTADMRVAANGDPQVYLKSVNDYGQKVRATMPEKLGDAMASDAERIGAQHYGSMVQQEHAQLVKNSQLAIEAQLASAKNEALALAAQPGGTHGPTWDTAVKRINGYYDQLTQNPLFDMPAEKAELEKKHFQSLAFATNVQTAVDQTFNRKGRAEATKVLDDQITNNADLNLSPPERQHFRQVALSRLQYLTDLQKSSVDGVNAAAPAMEHALRSRDMRPDDPVIDMAIEEAKRLGADEAAKRISAARELAGRSQPYDGLNNQDRSDAAMRGAPGSAARPMLPAIQNAFYGQESGFGANPRTSVDNAHGPMQVTPGTFQKYALPGERIDNPDDNKRVGDRILSIYHQRYGGDPARIAVAYFSGEGNVAPPGSPTPWINDAKDGNGKSTSSYVSDIQRRLGQPASFNYSREQVRDNPWLLSAYAHELSADHGSRDRVVGNVADAIVKGIQSGQQPSIENLAMVQQVAQTSPAIAEKYEKIKQAAEVDATAGALVQNRTAPEAIQAAEEYVRGTSGGDIYHQAIARGVRDEINTRVKALADSPYNEAVRRGWMPREPVPLNPSDPAQMARGMQERAVAAQAIGSHERDPDQSMIEPSALSMIKGVMTGGTADARMALVSSIANSGASESVLKATLGKLASDPDTLPLAVAGSLMRVNPEAARGVLEGQALLQQEPKLAPKKEELARSMSESLPFTDFANPTVRTGYEGAIKAYYAKLSAGQNDTTGILNQDRWDTSVKAITGGVSKFRGSKVIAPWYGASDAEFDGAVRSLTDADFANARTTNGEAFPASALKPSFSAAFTWNNWRLESLGDGKYKVFSGPDDPNKRVPLVDATTNRTFVLDLGAKRGQSAAMPITPYRPSAAALGAVQVGQPVPSGVTVR